MELKKIINQLQLELSAFKLTDDNPLDYGYLKDALIVANKSVFDEYVRTNLPLNGFYQTIDNLLMTCVEETVVIDGIVFESGTFTHKASLPPLVKTVGSRNISYFGVVGFDKDITLVSLNEFRSLEGARWTGRNPVGTIVGDIVILKNIPKGMTVAMMIALLTDCTKASNWPTDDMAEFPTASEYKVKLIVKKDILQTYGVSPDVQDDAQIAMAQQKQQRPQQEPQQDNNEQQ